MTGLLTLRRTTSESCVKQVMTACYHFEGGHWLIFIGWMSLEKYMSAHFENGNICNILQSGCV